MGDTVNKLVSEEDRATALLFGDAGSASALEPDSATNPLRFVLGSDGAGWRHLKTDGGALRMPSPDATPNGHLYLDGGEVFAFTLGTVPRLIAETLRSADWDINGVDAFVMHQANEFMLRHLAKRVKIPSEKLIVAMEGFGNTSCASIPLTITSRLREELQIKPSRLLLVGFGVGWSWGATALTCGPLVAPELVIV